MQQILRSLNIHPNLTFLEKSIIAIGVLDLLYIAWIILASLFGMQGGLNLKELELTTMVFVLFYVSLSIGGWGLLTRNPSSAILNYLHLPFRVLIGVFTFYPLFILIETLGIQLSAGVDLGLVIFTEAFRVAVVKKWQKSLVVTV